MVAFDLLYLNRYDLRKLPLFERKALLKKIIAETDIQFSESFEVDGSEMYKHACKTGLEGVVSKVRDSQYISGRVNDWVKKTCAQRETLAIAGFALDGSKWDGLYLGRRKGRGLIYAGKVDHGFNSASAKDLQTRLKPLIRKTQPYSKKIAHKGIWVEPSLLAEIEYRAKSAEGKVRHPFSRRSRYWVSETWRTPCLWCPLPSLACWRGRSTAGHRITGHQPREAISACRNRTLCNFRPSVRRELC
jgi:bifunctional non-homologous end joining protein LigD